MVRATLPVVACSIVILFVLHWPHQSSLGQPIEDPGKKKDETLRMSYAVILILLNKKKLNLN